MKKPKTPKKPLPLTSAEVGLVAALDDQAAKKRSSMRALCSLLFALACAACGDDAPTRPTPITPPPGIVIPAHVCVDFDGQGHRTIVECPPPTP